MKKFLFLNIWNPNQSFIGGKFNVPDTNENLKRISLKKLSRLFSEYYDIDDVEQHIERLENLQTKQENDQKWLFQVGSVRYNPIQLTGLSENVRTHLFIPDSWNYEEFIKIRNQHNCDDSIFMIDGCYIGVLSESGFLIKSKFEKI